jgi:hypothetical protein
MNLKLTKYLAGKIPRSRKQGSLQFKSSLHYLIINSKKVIKIILTKLI